MQLLKYPHLIGSLCGVLLAVSGSHLVQPSPLPARARPSGALLGDFAAVAGGGATAPGLQ